ncbi:hypothetical protein KTC96_08415 [Clostridium estertheticum]|nr:hypothetical protein [Clostridium estertheticum]WLC72577.1 hypothetical protein KTC96_08415 [Clostridium estertheticum]
MAEGYLGSNRYYYTQDEQGSTVYITDKEQRIKNEYCYDAFGNVLDSREDVHNRITYTGQQFDGITNQYYLRARFYNPVIGRFTQKDSYRGDGLNLYAYCGSNPVVYCDPSGYADCKSKTSAHNEAINNTDYSSISAYRGIDVEKIPIEYRADPRLTTQMNFKGKDKSGINAAGWERNASKHFNELLDEHPKYWSETNVTRIDSGLVPIVDKDFIQHFPQYNDTVGDKLIHHHIGGGGQATAVPETLHKGFGGIHNVEKEIGIRGNDKLTDMAETLSKDYKH